MKNNSDKKKALLVIALAFALSAISTYMVKDTHAFRTSGAIEGNGLLVGVVAVAFNVYGFVTYAEAKGRSGLLGLFLSFFTVAGLVVLLALKDLAKPKQRS